jgi:hypothetical protein
MTSCNGWRRVSKSHPCPICDRPDWCLIAKDGTAALCQRVESTRRVGDAGWLHRSQERPWRPVRRFVQETRFSAASASQNHLITLAAEFQAAANTEQLVHLAGSLGLSIDSLHRLGIGWSKSHRAWSFPMADSSGQVLGIRLRRPDGFKFAVRGGHEGLFLPTGIRDGTGPLLVCEGPTDTVALLDMGFEYVVGRPSCTGGIKLLVELVRRQQRPDVVIVADADEPGRRGAENLASVLLAYVPSARIVEPPCGCKDARNWLRAGGNRDDLLREIQMSPARRGVILARATSGWEGIFA